MSFVTVGLATTESCMTSPYYNWACKWDLLTIGCTSTQYDSKLTISVLGFLTKIQGYDFQGYTKNLKILKNCIPHNFHLPICYHYF